MEASLNTSLSTRQSARGALTLGWTQMMGSRPPKMWRHSTAARCTSSEWGLPPKCRESGATLFRRWHRGMVSRNIVYSHLNYVVCLCFPRSLTLTFFPLCQKGLEILTPTTKAVAGRPPGDNYQLLVAVVGSVTVTCVTILLALLALFFIRKMLLNRRRTFTYQSGSVRMHRRKLKPIWRRCFFVWNLMSSGWGDYSAV